MFNNKIFSTISLATKAGRCVSGEFSVEKAVKEGRAFLCVIAGDSSDNTKKMFYNMCSFYKVPIYFYGSKSELGHYMGKESRASLAVTDSGLADSIIKQLELEKAETQY